jgi:hypothetical protein
MLITAASAADIDVPVIDPAQFGITATPEVMHALAASMTTTVSQTLRAQYEAKYEAEIAQRIQAEVRQRVEAELANRVQAIYEQLLLSRRRMFGRSSETHAGQGRLFDEADALAQTTTEADEQAQLPLSSTVAAE